MSYYYFLNRIDKDEVKTIFELGSCNLEDGIKLSKYFDCKVYSFECNPDCLVECEKNISNLTAEERKNIHLVKKAVSLEDGEITFYPFDLQKYNNMGSSSLLKIDFKNRSINDPDYNRENVQKEIKVMGTRLDTFMNENNIQTIDLLCIDLQGYELNALKSLGKYLQKVRYIITECSIQTTYVGGANFLELNSYLEENNFRYLLSNKCGPSFPDLNEKGYTEFDALFVNTSGVD